MVKKPPSAWASDYTIANARQMSKLEIDPDQDSAPGHKIVIHDRQGSEVKANYPS
ncbi:MAG TPA: hypothetical protein V6D18_13060 [Thermosynechococcaceae cyanobacterium]